MWDKLRVRERDRKLAMLFVGVLVATGCATALASALAVAGPTLVVPVLAIFAVAIVKRALALRQSNYGPAPVGPLSPDERAKARAKLRSPCSKGLRY